MAYDHTPSSEVSLHQHVAACFGLDAQQFLTRYLALHRREQHAFWVVKAFIDLLMAAECALKAHIVLGSESELLEDVLYHLKKTLGHKIGDLAEKANQIKPSPLYGAVKQRLGHFDVQTRYALVADQSFFPAAADEWPKGLEAFRQIAYGPWRECAANEVAGLLEGLPSLPALPNSLSERAEFQLRLRATYKAANINPKKRPPAID